MSFAIKYVETAAKLIRIYDGSTPLVHLLKSYFAQNKKHGGRDRKLISHVCYCYYRLGQSVNQLSIEEKLKLALFLCNNGVGQWVSLYNENWLNNWSKNVVERIAFIQQQAIDFLPEKIFPWQDELSGSIDGTAFSIAHLTQPNLFLRIRPGHNESVVQRLRDTETSFQKVTNSSLALANATKLDGVLNINKEVVIQDLSSQQIAEFITPDLIDLNWKTQWKVWDCCTASGGKTILLHDMHKNNEMLLTDIRESIFHQLKTRLLSANIHQWRFDVADLTKQNNHLLKENVFDLVIADVPCTGSGTWARTPEQLINFTKDSLHDFVDRQKKIVSNIIPHIKENGYFLYITCSVFKNENEGVVEFMQQNFQLQLIKMNVIIGYDKKADTMFAALFKKVTA